VLSTWETAKTSGTVSLGKASAWVKYQMYNSQIPAQYRKGTFKITCSDTGSIGDND